MLSGFRLYRRYLSYNLVDNNLALQQDLYRLRSETQAAFDEAKSLERRWSDLEREQREVYQVLLFLLITPLLPSTNKNLQRFTPQFLLMRLRHATTAQDDTSEALASNFVQSSSTAPTVGTGKEIDDFVREFKDARKVYHKRVMWGERWASGQVAWRDD